jgi:hypothetical protein
MPVKLSTTINKIQSLSNNVNSKLISELCDYMKKNGLSDSHINNTLKTSMLFSEFLGTGVSFYGVKTKQQLINLDSKMKSPELDPGRKWITIWNDYLGDIKYFFRWLYNYKLIEYNQIKPASEWETPSFAPISSRIPPSPKFFINNNLQTTGLNLIDSLIRFTEKVKKMHVQKQQNEKRTF